MKLAILVVLFLFAILQTFVYWPSAAFTWIGTIIYGIYVIHSRKKDKAQGEG